ncbi:MAG: DUF2520 domain-containing protein [Saprospirales bacterium]|nr:DUF2520 domain-containing protein [Saprospirales bacterium]MBK8922981.1 DUF2520 domain-containing protein [Saprospirales bacterium]
MLTPNKIVIVGAGRIAHHLGKRLRAKGLCVTQVLSRSAGPGQELAAELRSEWSDRWSDIHPDADWVLLAVRDDAIEEVGAALAPYAQAALVTHTSGATQGAVLEPYFKRSGVFYPLQSFSTERMPVWSKIPFCIDARSEADVVLLMKVAKIIGNLAYRVNDDQRSVLHVAAVFANNFANHCFAIAEKIMEEKGLPFELLHPLMEETLAKALQDSPARMQTGPAMRGDTDTIRRHLEGLEQHPAWRELYRGMSQSINPAVRLPAAKRQKKS